jgi:hypothetical protein
MVRVLAFRGLHLGGIVAKRVPPASCGACDTEMTASSSRQPIHRLFDGEQTRIAAKSTPYRQGIPQGFASDGVEDPQDCRERTAC